MTDHRIGTQDEWQAERDELLKDEKELTRRGDELARRRRELPWVRVEKEYRFDTEDGSKTLAELFDGRSQLIVYHFMFGEDWTGGCPVCSSIADTLAPQSTHLRARDTTLLLSSRAPLEKLLAYRERMGWPIGWVSSAGNDSTATSASSTPARSWRRSWRAIFPRPSSRTPPCAGPTPAGTSRRGRG